MSAQPRFEPMTVGQILDRAFRLYRASFLRFLAVVSVIQVPVSLITFAILHALAQTATTAMTEQGGYVDQPPSFVAMVTPVLAVACMGMLARLLASAALAKSISESYLGRDCSVGRTYAHILPKTAVLIAASIAVTLVVGVGFLLLIVPGIIFSLWYGLTTQVIVVENVGPLKGMSRSKSLVSGNLGKFFSLNLVVFLLSLIIGWAFGALSRLATRGMTAPESLPTAALIRQGFSLAGELLVTPIGAAALVLLYYDLRIRKEGFDLEMLAHSLGTERAAAVEGTAETG